MSMLRNKVLALILGPEGVGLFAQLQTVQNFTSSAVPMGMQTGALKYIAQYKASQPELVPRYIATASRAFLVLSFITAALCVVFLKPISSFALDNRNLALYLVPPILGVPFLIQSQLWLTYLRAGLEIRAYSLALVLTALLSLPVIVPLVLLWGQMGAAIHLFIFAVIGYAIARAYANKSMSEAMKTDMKHSKFSVETVRGLTRFGAANLPVFALTMGMPFLVRTQIIHDLGFTANGIYQAVFAISSQYLVMPINAIQAYALPRVSQLRASKDINIEINSTLKLTLMLSTFSILVILLGSGILIPLLFSRKFLPAVSLLPWQMAGDLLRAVTFTIQTPLLPQERFRARNIMHILQYSVFLLVFYLTPPSDRLLGATRAHAACWAFAFAATFIYTRWLNGYTFDRANWRLVLTSAVAVISVAFLSIEGPQLKLISAGIAVAWTVTAFSRKDVAALVRAVRERLTSNR